MTLVYRGCLVRLRKTTQIYGDKCDSIHVPLLSLFKRIGPALLVLFFWVHRSCQLQTKTEVPNFEYRSAIVIVQLVLLSLQRPASGPRNFALLVAPQLRLGPLSWSEQGQGLLEYYKGSVRYMHRICH